MSKQPNSQTIDLGPEVLVRVFTWASGFRTVQFFTTRNGANFLQLELDTENVNRLIQALKDDGGK